MPERYQVVIDGIFVTVDALGRRKALAVALRAVDENPACSVVTVIDAERLEARARWSRSAVGWRVQAQPGWL